LKIIYKEKGGIKECGMHFAFKTSACFSSEKTNVYKMYETGSTKMQLKSKTRY